MSREYDVQDGEINYLCNALGEFNYGLTYESLSEVSPDLRNAYDDLLNQGAGFDTYLVQYNGQLGVAVVDHFPEEFFNEYGGTVDAVDEMADYLTMDPQLSEAQVLTGSNDVLDGYAMTVIFPCDMPAEDFRDALGTIQSAENQMLNEVSFAIDEPEYKQGIAR